MIENWNKKFVRMNRHTKYISIVTSSRKFEAFSFSVDGANEEPMQGKVTGWTSNKSLYYIK